MKTGNRWRDGDMREMFDTTIHPEERRVAYDRWRSQEVERIKQAMPATEIDSLTERVRERLADRAGSRQAIGLESFVGREVNHVIAESHDLPPYEV